MTEYEILQMLQKMSLHSMVDFLEIKFIAYSDRELKATMPVNEKTKQPFGVLHGGASAVLAETVGSAAGNLQVDITKQHCVGVQLSINHLKSVKEGVVSALAKPLHVGSKTQVWNIDIENENNQMVATARLTLAVVDK